MIGGISKNKNENQTNSYYLSQIFLINFLHMKRIILFWVVFLWHFVKIYGQNSNLNVISSAGNTFYVNNVQLDWTLGELAITTLENNTHKITQGFHQPDYYITAVESPFDFPYEISLFPNPVTRNLNFKIQLENPQSLIAEIFDSTGRILRSFDYYGREISETVAVEALPCGQYLFRLSVKNKQVTKSFIIQKTF